MYVVEAGQWKKDKSSSSIEWEVARNAQSYEIATYTCYLEMWK